jgi:hypothetical protein
MGMIGAVTVGVGASLAWGGVAVMLGRRYAVLSRPMIGRIAKRDFKTAQG